MKHSLLIHENLIDKTYIGEYQGIITDTDTIDFIGYSLIDYWPSCTKELALKYRRVALIDILKIKKEYRGMGYGAHLLGKIFKKSLSHNSDAIVLMADTSEKNPFNLVTWYENQGFKLYIDNGHAFPLMIKEIKK